MSKCVNLARYLTLAAGIDYLLANRETYRIHSVVVIRNDRVVLDARFYPFSREWKHGSIAAQTSIFCRRFSNERPG